MSSNVLEKVKATVLQYNMLEESDHIVVGLSGGADSMTLLSVLYELSDEYNLKLTAAHVNHGIRGEEADRDEEFCKKVCHDLGIQIYTFHIDVPAYAKERGVSLEVAGRDVRYEFFLGLAGEEGKIATAHNAQDSVETLMLNLCRGAGLKGLTGIPPVREIEHKAGCHSDGTIKTKVIRPIITCTREEIEEYLKEKGQSFVTDSTNLEDEYTRNRVRHNIIPELALVNERAVGNINRCVESLRDDNEFLEGLANDLANSAVVDGGYNTRILLLAEKPILSRTISKIIFDSIGSYPEKVHIQKIIDMMNVGRTDQVQIPSGAYVRVEKGKLKVIK